MNMLSCIQCFLLSYFHIFLIYTYFIIVHCNEQSYKDMKMFEPHNIPFVSFFKYPPTVRKWNTIDTPNRFSIISITVDHSIESKWYMKSLHERYSYGWNRTNLNKHFSGIPHACTIRLFGIGLESTLDGYIDGGTG